MSCAVPANVVVIMKQTIETIHSRHHRRHPMVTTYKRTFRRAARAFAPALLASLLFGCTSPPVSDDAAGRVYTPLIDPVATISAQATLNPTPGLGDNSLAVAYPASSDAASESYPLLDATNAPLPPTAAASTGQLVMAKEIARAEAAALAQQSAAIAEQEASTLPTPVVDAEEARPLVETSSGDPFDWSTSENFLVMGTDRRAEGGSWRTDSIMVIGIDRAKERAAVFSVPRDTYVQIPGYGFGRINQADYMGERRTPDGGGPALVSAILEENLGISTQHWVRIQMDGFVSFVDAMGGVDVYLDCPFSEPILNLNTNAWTNFNLPAGLNHLDGQDAYWFARLRYRESDIGRSSRQRAIIWALREQILSTNAILRLPQLYAAYRDTISTDLSLFDIISMAQFAVSLKPENVRAGGLTLKDLQNYTTAGGAQVLIIADPARVRDLVANVWDQPAMADAYRKDGAKCVGGIATPEPAATPVLDDSPEATPLPPDDSIGATQGGGPAATAGASSADSSALALPLTGPVVDPVTGALFDLATGYPLDAVTGKPYDPVTGKPVASPASGN